MASESIGADMLKAIAMARTLLELRSPRDDLLAPVSSLAEPCWLILLQLFSAEHAENRTSSSIARLLDIGAAPAERSLRLLEQEGFLRLLSNDSALIALLEPSTIRAMEKILDEMRQRSRVALNC